VSASSVKAAESLGLTEVPCVLISHLSDHEQRVLRIAINRMNQKGVWDLDQLKLEFEELILNDAPLEVSGFGQDEIDQIVMGDDLEVVEEGDLTPHTVASGRRRSNVWTYPGSTSLGSDAREDSRSIRPSSSTTHCSISPIGRHRQPRPARADWPLAHAHGRASAERSAPLLCKLHLSAGSWTKSRRVVAKVEWHPGELYPRVGFIVTNMARLAENVVAFYNNRGT
jgi:hypothetical protein